MQAEHIRPCRLDVICYEIGRSVRSVRDRCAAAGQATPGGHVNTLVLEFANVACHTRWSLQSVKVAQNR